MILKLSSTYCKLQIKRVHSISQSGYSYMILPPLKTLKSFLLDSHEEGVVSFLKHFHHPDQSKVCRVMKDQKASNRKSLLKPVHSQINKVFHHREPSVTHRPVWGAFYQASHKPSDFMGTQRSRKATLWQEKGRKWGGSLFWEWDWGHCHVLRLTLWPRLKQTTKKNKTSYGNGLIFLAWSHLLLQIQSAE